MLQSISWQEFFTAIGLIATAYYLITTLLLYSKEITATLKGKWTSLPEVIKSDQKASSEASSIMGGIRAESLETVARETSISSEEIVVSEPRSVDEPIEITSITVTIEDDVASLSSEIDALARIVAHSDRDESLPLFQSLISRYASLVNTDHVEQLSQLLHDKVSEHCGFQIELDEIRGWWSQADERARYKTK